MATGLCLRILNQNVLRAFFKSSIEIAPIEIAPQSEVCSINLKSELDIVKIGIAGRLNIHHQICARLIMKLICSLM